MPGLDFVFTQPKIVYLIKSLLGEVDPRALRLLVSGWHKESGETVKGYFQGDCFAAEARRVYKAAIYIQDGDDRGGLTVRRGSHRGRSWGPVRVVRLDVKAGDVALFDVRPDRTVRCPTRSSEG